MTAQTQTTILNDAQMAERLKKLIDRNNIVNNREIRVQTEADMAEKAAKTEAEDALANFQVNSLGELRDKAKKVYEEDIAALERFESEVAAREARVAAAEKILADASAQ